MLRFARSVSLRVAAVCATQLVTSGNPRRFLHAAPTARLIAAINVGRVPFGIAVRPDDRRVRQVSNNGSRVDIIDTASNSVSTNVSVDAFPVAQGQFIRPSPPLLFRSGFENP